MSKIKQFVHENLLPLIVIVVGFIVLIVVYRISLPTNIVPYGIRWYSDNLYPEEAIRGITSQQFKFFDMHFLQAPYFFPDMTILGVLSLIFPKATHPSIVYPLVLIFLSILFWTYFSKKIGARLEIFVPLALVVYSFLLLPNSTPITGWENTSWLLSSIVLSAGFHSGFYLFFPLVVVLVYEYFHTGKFKLLIILDILLLLCVLSDALTLLGYFAPIIAISLILWVSKKIDWKQFLFMLVGLVIVYVLYLILKSFIPYIQTDAFIGQQLSNFLRTSVISIDAWKEHIHEFYLNGQMAWVTILVLLSISYILERMISIIKEKTFELENQNQSLILMAGIMLVVGMGLVIAMQTLTGTYMFLPHMRHFAYFFIAAMILAISLLASQKSFHKLFDKKVLQIMLAGIAIVYPFLLLPLNTSLLFLPFEAGYNCMDSLNDKVEIDDFVIWADYWYARPTNMRTGYQPMLVSVAPVGEELLFFQPSMYKTMMEQTSPDGVFVAGAVTYEQAMYYVGEGAPLIYSCNNYQFVDEYTDGMAIVLFLNEE